MAFFDVRVLHPEAKYNAKHRTTAKMYGHHERSKERKYGDRCTQIEKGTLNGLVFSTTGGMGPQATVFLKRVATLLAAKARTKAIPVDELDLNLVHTTNDEDNGDDVDDVDDDNDEDDEDEDVEDEDVEE